MAAVAATRAWTPYLERENDLKKKCSKMLTMTQGDGNTGVRHTVFARFEITSKQKLKKDDYQHPEASS